MLISKTKPAIFEKQGFHTFYRFLIAGSEDGYTYMQVPIQEPVTGNSLLRRAYSRVYPPSIEAKLINDYNEAVITQASEEKLAEVTEAYSQMLRDRAAIKAQAEIDAAEWDAAHPEPDFDEISE